MLKKEDPDNRLLALLRDRDQKMARRKEMDSPEIAPVTVLPAKQKKPSPKQSLKEVLQELEENYKPVQDYFTMVDNIFFDELAGNISSSSQVVYLHLYRLSHGWNKPYCKVGRKTLNERTNMSKSTIKRAIKELKDQNYIKELHWGSDGTVFQVLLPREILGIVNLTIPKMTTPSSQSVVKMTIPKMDIVKMTIPEEMNNNNDSEGVVKMTIPKMDIVKMTTPEEMNNNNDSEGVVKMTIPKMDIVKMTTPDNETISNMDIPKMDIVKMTTPDNESILNMDIVKMTTPKKTPQNKDSSGVVKMTISKMNPNKYNIYKNNSLSKKREVPHVHEHSYNHVHGSENINPPPEKKFPPLSTPGEREREIIENFYKSLGVKKLSSEKRKKGIKEINQLLADGYDISEIEFAAKWSLENEDNPPKSFSLIPHCIDQALKEMEEFIKVEKKQEKEREDLQLWEQQRDEGAYLDRYYNNLGEKEKEALEEEANRELAQTNPHSSNKNIGFMRDLLVKMKMREIIRKKYFSHKEKG